MIIIMLIKQVSTGLLSFIALQQQNVCLEPLVFRPSLTDLNPVELKHDPFMVILVKVSGSCNSANGVSTKTYVTSKTNVFIIITKLNKAKTMVKHISWDGKIKYNNTTSNSNQKQNSKTRQ